MNLEKSTKLIAKRVKKGFQGYPQISLTYQDASADSPSQVIIGFTAEENDTPQEQVFTSPGDVRCDESIQTTLLKIIERSDAKTVLESHVAKD